jgi:N-acetylglucosamine-6-phosphate deacetylase
MASLYPAAILKLDDSLGRIASGYRADLVHFNENFTVYNTWLAGQRQSHIPRSLSENRSRNEGKPF